MIGKKGAIEDILQLKITIASNVDLSNCGTPVKLGKAGQIPLIYYPLWL